MLAEFCGFAAEFCGMLREFCRILRICCGIMRENQTLFAEFDGNLQNSAQFVGISAKNLRNVASIFVSTGRCFDWWRPTPNMNRP